MFWFVHSCLMKRKQRQPMGRISCWRMELAEVIWLLIKSIEGDDNTRVNPTASAGRKITESIPLSCIHGRQHQSTSATKAGERDTAGSVASHASSQGNMLNTTWSMRSAPSEVRMSSAKWNVGIDGGQRTGGSRIGNCGIYHKDTKMCPCSTEFIWISVEFRRHENKTSQKTISDANAEPCRLSHANLQNTLTKDWL